MASIKKRILQILEEKEPISLDSLTEEIKNRAFNEIIQLLRKHTLNGENREIRIGIAII